MGCFFVVYREEMQINSQQFILEFYNSYNQAGKFAVLKASQWKTESIHNLVSNKYKWDFNYN